MKKNKNEIENIFKNILKMNKETEQKNLRMHFVNLDEIDSLDSTQPILLLDSELDTVSAEMIDKIFIYELIETYQERKTVFFFRISTQYFYMQISQEFSKMNNEDHIRVKSLSPIKIINYIKQKHNFEEDYLENIIEKDFVEELKKK
jgi:acyl carrier protein